jgi:predicted MFS family arabinose efflux permease
MANPLGGIGAAFADRNFRIYSVGAIVSWLSYFVQDVALAWLTWDLTHSTTWLAVIAVLEIGPNVLILPFGGVLADRIDRRRIVIVTHAAALLQAAILAFLAYEDRLTIGALAVLTFAHGVIHGFSVPGLFGMLPRFVARERLAAAIGVNAAYTQFAIFAGPALAGWIMLHHGAAVAFATNVIGYAAYIGSVLLLRSPPDYQPPAPTGKSVLGDLVDGLRYVTGHRGISALLFLMLVGDGLAAALYEMLPAYADKALGMGVDGMSTLLAAAGLGATAAALWLAHGGAERASSGRVLWAFLVLVLAIATLMVTRNLFVAVALMLLFGIAGQIRRTGTVALLQISVDDSQRGRVMSTQFLLQRAASGIGVVAIGAAAEHGGLRAPMLIGAALALAAWLYTFKGRDRIAAAFRG